MRLLHVWWDPSERDRLRRLVTTARPDWTIDACHERDIMGVADMVRLMLSGYDVLLLQISLPYALAVKAAEIAHRRDCGTRVVLYSRTSARPELLAQLFDGVIHVDRDSAAIADRIEQIRATSRQRLSTETDYARVLTEVLNASESVLTSYRSEFGVTSKTALTLEDYWRLIDASVLRGQSIRFEVFISFASADREMLDELLRELQLRKLRYYSAQWNPAARAKGVEHIRQALVNSHEVLLILTPASVVNAWMLMEAGCAWSLGKRVTVCLHGVEVSALPEPLRLYPNCRIESSVEIEALAEAVAARYPTSP